MNTQFTDEQIKAYAAAFRDGDAVWCDGEWFEIVVNGNYGRLSTRIGYSKNHFNVNGGEELEFEGVTSGFDESSLPQDRYRVTTLDDYELQGGEKIVWLGKSDGFRTFGKVYEVNNDARYRDDNGQLLLAIDSLWGIIPRYEQVKCKEKRDVTNEEFDNFLNELDKTLGYVKKDNQLEHVVHYPTAADREEEVLKLKTFELMLSGQTVDELIEELKEVAHIEINKGNYDEAEKAIELIKAWEESK